jgi:hypothetical protein
MTRRSQLIIVVVFGAVLALPALLLVAGVIPKNLENRAASEAPTFQAGSLIDDGYYAGLAGYLTDRLPLRDKAIKLDAELRSRLTVTEPFDPDRPRGSDGWLYHPDTLVDTCVGPPPDVFLAEGDEVAEQLSQAEIPYVYVIAPDKVSVYPEHLPVEGVAGLLGLQGGDVAACNHLWDQAMRDGAEDREWLVPLADDLRADLGDPDEPLFYKVDTHWTDAGSLNMVEAVVERFAPGMWQQSAVVPSAPDEKAGDASVLRGEQTLEEVPGYVVERPGVTTTYDRAAPGEEAEVVDVSRSTSTYAPLIEGTTVFLGDSFGRHAMELLGPFFEELIWINRDYFRRYGFGGAIEGPPDAILFEQVQRNVTKGWFTDYLDTVKEYLNDGG